MAADPVPTSAGAWPRLALDEWRDTWDTLLLWTQVIGKVKLASTAQVNHWWNASLRLSSRGLTTLPMFSGIRAFQVDLDLVDHRLVVSRDDGETRDFGLESLSVARFHALIMDALRELGVEVSIYATPVELPTVIPFAHDEEHSSYDPVHANRFFRTLLQAERVLRVFRARFVGKVSPVHYFWGAGDLAVTRFSGRSAPPHPGGVPNCPDWVMTEAYSHEVSSCGFWPGGYGVDACFYAYAYPEPKGFRDHPIAVDAATYDTNLGEFLLPYEVVRTAADPDAILLRFLQDTYEAAAIPGGWDRAALERDPASAIPRAQLPAG